MKLSKWVCMLALALACLPYGPSAWAQSGTGELTGLVTDATGAVVPGVEINLTNSATGSPRVTVTSSAGIYRFVALPIVGTYTVAVQQAGFKAVRVEGIVISVGTTVTRDIKLELGAIQETVTVTAGAELVQATESAVSTLVDRNIWEKMPLEVRNQNAFIELVPGAVPDSVAGSTRGAAVNGARGGTGNYLVAVSSATVPAVLQLRFRRTRSQNTA
jgi:Carboxypeptidase regulatory-like domain